MSDPREPQREPVDDSESATEDLEPSEAEAESVRGGTTPNPGGPVPIPYPNTNR